MIKFFQRANCQYPAALMLVISLSSCDPVEIPLPGERIDLLPVLQPTLTANLPAQETIDFGISTPCVSQMQVGSNESGNCGVNGAAVPLLAARIIEYKGIQAKIGNNNLVFEQPVYDQGILYSLFDSVTIKAYTINSFSFQLLWQATLDEVIERDSQGGGLALADNKLYVTNGSEALYVLSTSDGSRIWQAELPQIATSAPTVAAGTVFVKGVKGKLAAYAADFGNRLWVQESESSGLVYLPGSSPALLAAVGGGTGQVISGQPAGIIISNRPQSGLLVWQSRLITDGNLVTSGIADFSTTPLVTDQVAVVSNKVSGLVGIDVIRGSKLWQQPIYNRTGGRHAGMAMLVVDDDSAEVFALRTVDGGIYWRTNLMQHPEIAELVDDEIWWRPVLLAGSVYVVAGNGVIVQLDPGTGDLIGLRDLEISVVNNPLVYGNQILLANSSGSLWGIVLGSD